MKKLYKSLYMILMCGLAMVSTAKAEDKPGFYVGVEAGWSSGSTTLHDVNTSSTNCVFCTKDTEGKSDSAAVVGLTSGYRLDDLFRAEFETGYRTGYNFGGTNAGNVLSSTQNVRIWSTMVNGYVEPITYYGFKPYVGFGIGVAFDQADSGTFYFGGTPQNTGANLQTNFAWQALVGVSYPVTSSLNIDLGYRYLDAGQFRTSTTTGTNAADPIKGDLSANELIVGLRYAL